MLSYVLYGRNDNYGYNLHKRAALSLNCMAEVLTSPDDEILFVDYNTPDDFPTFPEAIQDTLTAKAKRHLRIFRVRPALHQARFAAKTHLKALEPVSRNIAIRRSNPANRWILSTNTDMIFVPRRNQSLTEIVGDLPGGYYGIPRFELPETLWETLDRQEARGIISKLESWGRQFHLNEIVFSVPAIRFDVPGDFQLIERADLFVYHGFHEAMLLGWHVDSNIAKRLSLIYPEVGDLTDRLFGYHCDHTRQITPMHRQNAVENSWDTFFEEVDRPDVPDQAETWGCSDAEIEEIRLDRTRNSVYVSALETVIGAQMAEPDTVGYIPETYDKVTYAPPHVLPFLADIFVNAPPGFSIAWIGGNPEMLRLFSALWRKMEMGGKLLVWDGLADMLGGALLSQEKIASLDALFEAADAFVFDYCIGEGKMGQGEAPAPGTPESQALLSVKYVFLDLVGLERQRIAAARPPRRFVAVNAINNSFETLVTSFVGAARSPFSARIRQGFVVAAETGPLDWTAKMVVGHTGVRFGSEIRTRENEIGYMMWGPHIPLLPGKYNVMVRINRLGVAKSNGLPLEPIGFIEAVAGESLFVRREFCARDLQPGQIELAFEVKRDQLQASHEHGVEIRIWSMGDYMFAVSGVTLKPFH
jgi:hypothetical protein